MFFDPSHDTRAIHYIDQLSFRLIGGFSRDAFDNWPSNPSLYARGPRTDVTDSVPQSKKADTEPISAPEYH